MQIDRVSETHILKNGAQRNIDRYPVTERKIDGETRRQRDKATERQGDRETRRQSWIQIPIRVSYMRQRHPLSDYYNTLEETERARGRQNEGQNRAAEIDRHTMAITCSESISWHYSLFEGSTGFDWNKLLLATKVYTSLDKLLSACGHSTIFMYLNISL